MWDLDYQTEEASDHVAKFRGDWPTELRDLVANKNRKERNISSKTYARRELPSRAAKKNSNGIRNQFYKICLFSLYCFQIL